MSPLKLTALLLLPACSSKDPASSPVETAGATPEETGQPPAGDSPAGDSPGGDSGPGESPAPDSGERPPPLSIEAPFAPAADPLLGSDVLSCALYQQQRCEDGAASRCAVYDTVTEAFVDAVDPLFERVLLYERWYDLYHQPDGITAERYFAGATAAGTAEAEWGATAHFSHFEAGDGAIWTGVALEAFALRYINTGTEADYARLEDKARAAQTMFEVAGVPGYLVRYYYMHYTDAEPPLDDQHISEGPGHAPDHRDRPFDPTGAPDIDPWFTSGAGTPMWHGNPSIDQYTGPMVSYPVVWPLLRDAALADRMSGSLVCYLNRLTRIEIHNLSENPDAAALVQAFIAGGQLLLDEDDIDLSAIDDIVFFGLGQPNDANADSFEAGCPDGPPLEAAEVLDAADSDFLVELLGLVARMASGTVEMADAIDHVYAPSIRGGDAAHLMNLAAQAWWYTGDSRYLEFLEGELIGAIRADRVALTAGALQQPRWCQAYYGPHITFPAQWVLTELLPEGYPLRETMQRVLEEEMWEKLIGDHANAKFQLMYAGVASAGAGASEGLAEALSSVETLGGNGGVLADPRRRYTLEPAWVVDNLPEGVEVDCPTTEERGLCEDGFDVLGIPFPGESISYGCSGAANECALEDGLCADALGSAAMPMDYRVWEDFLWQRSPFKLGRTFGTEGEGQSPGLDLIEAFWLARTYGFTSVGEGQVLAWRDAGSCE